MDFKEYLPGWKKKPSEDEFVGPVITPEMKALIDERNAANELAEKGKNEIDYLQRELGELECELAGANDEIRKYKHAGEMVYESHAANQAARDDIVADILLGPTSKVSTKFEMPDWLTEAVIRKAKEHRDNDHASRQRLSEIEGNKLAYFVNVICEHQDIQKVPLIVYDKDGPIYKTQIFDEMVHSSTNLEEEIESNGVLDRAIRRGKKATMSYDGGVMHFIPEKLKNNDPVTVAYFVPKEAYFMREGGDNSWNNKKNWRSKTFAKAGEKGAMTIYKTLKSLDERGMDF